ncbi:folliculin [Fopius arisanus]|uniref:Folliculin n=2 Tax=Braconidae TaxID=7402 RepID=A0A0C9RKV8_9HYME|nr:PREDICTED: folliculin [Fopius arisanus]
MNAVIAMCTFCEVHGPRVIFTTQTYRIYDKDDKESKKLKFYGPREILEEADKRRLTGVGGERKECDGCESLGNVKYLSNEHDSRTSFVSARQPLTQDIANLLAHACIRSLSCELHLGKNGVCYFGDEVRGHVLSHAFTLKDAQARGIRRSCSFIVFMKDKQFLLNMCPFFVDNLRQVIKELQDFAEKKYNADEKENPQRAARLSSANREPHGNRETARGMPRGLPQITDEKHIFVRIHMWLVWILSAGARHFVESSATLDSPLSGFLIRYQDFTENPEFSEISKKKFVTTVLREISQQMSREHFRQLLFACLTGIQIVVRGPDSQALEILYALSSLVPKSCRRIQMGADEYKNINECNFLGIDTLVAVPAPSSHICRLDIIPEEHKSTYPRSPILRWTGELPQKLPTLVAKLEKYIYNDKLENNVLRAQFIALQEEWANIAKIVHAMRGRGHRGDLSGLIMSLGADKHDLGLIDSWSMGLPSNPA